jgi:hypothetical protein
MGTEVEMAGDSEPRAPFVYREDEPLIGEGSLLRTRGRRTLTVGLLVLLVVAVVVAIQVPRMLWSRSLDLGVNSQTGLPDGRYVLEPSSSMHEGDACWFRGTVRGLPDYGEVTVVGRGPVQCAGRWDYVGRVLFSVEDGTAAITRAGGG